MAEIYCTFQNETFSMGEGDLKEKSEKLQQKFRDLGFLSERLELPNKVMVTRHGPGRKAEFAILVVG